MRLCTHAMHHLHIGTARTYVYICTSTDICPVCMHTHHTYIHMYVHIYVCTYVCTYVRTYIPYTCQLSQIGTFRD